MVSKRTQFVAHSRALVFSKHIPTKSNKTLFTGFFVMSNATVLRLPETLKRTGISRAAAYQKLDPNSPYYDETFPKPVKLGARSVGWSSEKIQVWIDSKLNGGAAQ
ncbi:MAG: AlpA family phage regulatory protein [Methylobacter sp.]|nr:AlpA family phage regulatory protein [Methylobacter sp.]